MIGGVYGIVKRNLTNQAIFEQLPGALGDEVHLWVAPEELARSGAGRSACLRLLTEEERRREARFHHERDRTLYRLARALTRLVLSGYAGVDPKEWTFARNHLGQPRIEAPPEIPLAFSVAHTPGLVLLLVASDAVIGVDVEDERRATAMELPRLVFGDLELADLASRGDGSRRRQLEYWTLKEAYSKACGAGLSLPLNRCVFRIEPDRIELQNEPHPVSKQMRWWFSLPDAAAGYVTAVAVGRRRSNEPPPELTTILLDSWVD
jgi:4'-phosphopantetheinyl transferase